MIFSQNEIMLMIGVVSVLLLCITVLTILDIREYLKAKRGIVVEEENLTSKYEEKEEVLEPIDVSIVEDNSNTLATVIQEEKPSEVYLEEVEEEHFETKPEVNPIIEEEEEVFVPQENETYIPNAIIEEVKENVPQVEISENKKDLDIFEDYDEIENNLPNKKDDVTNFEAEQERTAIISLDELMKKSDELYSDNEVVQYDEGNEPISIDEVIKMFKKEETLEPVMEEVTAKEVPKVFKDVVEAKAPYSKKESIPFISSVYGIEKENNALEFENTATYEKLDREKYNDFASQLKEMNENK